MRHILGGEAGREQVLDAILHQRTRVAEAVLQQIDSIGGEVTESAIRALLKSTSRGTPFESAPCQTVSGEIPISLPRVLVYTHLQGEGSRFYVYALGDVVDGKVHLQWAIWRVPLSR